MPDFFLSPFEKMNSAGNKTVTVDNNLDSTAIANNSFINELSTKFDEFDQMQNKENTNPAQTDEEMNNVK